MLSRDYCVPPPNLFPFVADDPSVAVWRICLACALLLGVVTCLLVWRVRTPRAALLPLAGTLGCLALALVAWIQSLSFIQVLCTPSLNFPPEEYQRVVERAQAALRLNMVYQGLAVAAIVVTLAVLVWGTARLVQLSRKSGPARDAG